MNTKLVQATKVQIPVLLNYMEHFYSIDDYSFSAPEAKRNLELFIENEQLGVIWLVRSESEFIGYLILTFGFSFEYGGRDAFIDEFFLLEEYRGKGHGNKVMGMLEEEARKREVRAIHLEVEAHNEKAIGLYRRSGYAANNRSLLSKRLS